MSIDKVRIQQLKYYQTIKHKTMDDVVKVVDHVCYVMPDSDEDYIIAVIPRECLATNTNFYDADDFYEGSWYNYGYVDGILRQVGL